MNEFDDIMSNGDLGFVLDEINGFGRNIWGTLNF